MVGRVQAEFLRLVKWAALCNVPTLDVTAVLCSKVIDEGVPGDFVECGVFAGAHPAVMSKAAASDTAARRLVHLFDSFQGIPEAGPRDDETITGFIGPSQEGRLLSTGKSVCPQKEVAGYMKTWGAEESLLVYHEGWFQDTVPVAEFPSGIAVLRLDGDLYESTKVCLEHLHPLVPRGGYVIVDDYRLTGCRAACDEYHAKAGIKPEIIEIPGGDGPVYYRVEESE